MVTHGGIWARLREISAIRLLLLLAVWGLAVFLWGTFGAWTYKQAFEKERNFIQPFAASVQDWLYARTASLDKLVEDERLAQGVTLPAGAASLPVQRVLYEYAYLNREPDVYAVDLLRGTSGHTAGATPLKETDLVRLQTLPHTQARIALAMGRNNAQLLLLRRVEAPLPQRLFAGVPVGLSVLIADRPALPPALEGRKVMLLIPHANGWAAWDMVTPHVSVPEELLPALEHKKKIFEDEARRVTLVPLTGLPGVVLGVEGPPTMLPTATLPKLLVLLWAVAMTVMILWHEPALAGIVRKATQQLAPALGPLLAPLNKALGPLAALAGTLKAGVKRLGSTLPLASLNHAWREAQDNAPLLDGPGHVDSHAFEGAPRRTLGPARRKAPHVMKQAAALATTPGLAALNKVERRQRQRGSAVMGSRTGAGARDATKAAWTFTPTPTPPTPTPLESTMPALETKVDDENMLELVKDCLRMRRVKLLFQPVYRSGDNMPVMHEVFARLVTKEGRVLSPAEFLPVTIQNRMALELDLLVLRQVVHQHFNGQEPGTPLALNISSNSLDGIAYLQEMTSLGPRVLRRLGFEVRSQEMIRDPKALRLLKDLQRHGGNLAVDYFGGGTAMLEASKTMEFNYVKLDCLRFMDNDEGKKQLIKLAQHATSLGLPIILEKVSTRDQEDFARAVGIEFLQGYALKTPQDTLTLEPLNPGVGQIAAGVANPPGA